MAPSACRTQRAPTSASTPHSSIGHRPPCWPASCGPPAPSTRTATRTVPLLDTLIDYLPDRADELRAAKATPLGVLPHPDPLPQGCIAAGDRAFFCEYVLQYLARAGLTMEDVARNGYLIRTTLDPKVQDSVKSAIDKRASPDTDGVASVMSVIIPGKNAHRVVAM